MHVLARCSPPVQYSHRNKETTGEASKSSYDGRETESFGREGTDESNEESYPGLVEGNVGENNLKVDKKVVGVSVHQLWGVVCVYGGGGQSMVILIIMVCGA